MSWKKNIFSYILWIVYSGATCVGILGMSGYAVGASDYNVVYGYSFAGAFLLLTGLLVLFLRRLILKKNNSGIVSEEGSSDTVIYRKLAETLILVLLLAAGLWLRIDQLMSIAEATAGTAYIEAAYVTEGGTIPIVVHGATYLYLWLLHTLFLLFGNHVAVALILQIVLQLLGALFLYFSVRKLAGVLSASVSFGFLMLSPYMVDQCAEGSPAFLLFLLYSIVLCCVAGCLKTRCNPLWIVLAGVTAGVVSYLDVFGITILLFFVSVLTLEGEKAGSFWNGKTTVILFGLVGTAAGFFLAIGVDAWASGTAYGKVLSAWYKLYQPAFSMALAESNMLAESIWNLLDIFLLLLGMAVGCFSFWCRKKYTRQGVWIALAVVTTIMLVFQMGNANAGCEAYLYIVFAVLAGIGIEAVWVTDAVEIVEVQAVEINVFAEPQVIAQPEAAVEIQVFEDVEINVEAQKESVKIQFLDNPLPVPKKHTPKTLDYRFQGRDGDQFDLDIAEDDDFDI